MVASHDGSDEGAVKVHACHRKPFTDRFFCESCTFVGGVFEAIAHAVKRQFVVTR